MRKFLPTISIITLVVFASCGDDSIANLPLTGTTWTEVSFEVKDCDDDADNRFTECSGDDCESFILNEDETVTFLNQETEDIQFTYEISGDQLTIIGTTSEFTISASITFQVIGNSLILTDMDNGCSEIYIYEGS